MVAPRLHPHQAAPPRDPSRASSCLRRSASWRQRDRASKACKASSPCCFSRELSMFVFLRHGHLDGADETLRAKFAPRNSTRDPFVNQVASQALTAGLLHPRSANLFPDNAEVVLAVPRYFPPGDVHFPATTRQRAILGGVRRQLVQHKAHPRFQIGRQNYLGTFDTDSIGPLSYVGLELNACQRLEIGALPVRLHQEAVGTRHGREPAAKALDKLSRRWAASERLVCDRLNDRQCILDPVGQLAEQELLACLQFLALGDVAGAFQNQPPP